LKAIDSNVLMANNTIFKKCLSLDDIPLEVPNE